jgi:hypothetical protein
MNTTWLCTPCRTAARAHTTSRCPRCSRPMTDMGTRWRPPPLRDTRAWQRITTGDIWTEPAPTPRNGARLPYTTTDRPQLQQRWQPRTTAVQDARQKQRRGAIPEDLTAWATSPDQDLRQLAAADRHTPATLLTALTHDSAPEVRTAVYTNPSLPADHELWLRGSRDTSAAVRTAIAARTDTGLRILRRLTHDRDITVLRAVAQRTELDLAALGHLPFAVIPATRLTETGNPDLVTILAMLREEYNAAMTLRQALDAAALILR